MFVFTLLAVADCIGENSVLMWGQGKSPTLCCVGLRQGISPDLVLPWLHLLLPGSQDWIFYGIRYWVFYRISD